MLTTPLDKSVNEVAGSILGPTRRALCGSSKVIPQTFFQDEAIDASWKWWDVLVRVTDPPEIVGKELELTRNSLNAAARNELFLPRQVREKVSNGVELGQDNVERGLVEHMCKSYGRVELTNRERRATVLRAITVRCTHNGRNKAQAATPAVLLSAAVRRAVRDDDAVVPRY